METLVLKFKNKKNFKLIKELAERLEGTKEPSSLQRKKSIHEKEFWSEKEFRALSGIAKGQLVSKEHLRSLSWKKRNW